MHTLYVATVIVHLLAVMTWLGGMFFLMLVVVPWLRKGDRAQAARLLSETGTRFRTVGWICFAVLAATGTALLYFRGVTLDNLTDAGWRSTGFGQMVLGKLLTFLGILGLSAVHDFRIGPMASEAVSRDPNAPEAERLRRLASQMGRLNVILGLLMVFFAVQIVRGTVF